MQKECQQAFPPGKTGEIREPVPPELAIPLRVTSARSFFARFLFTRRPVIPIVELGTIAGKNCYFDVLRDYDGWASDSEEPIRSVELAEVTFPFAGQAPESIA
jgi:hypothetical protein